MTELPPGVRVTGGRGGTVAVLADLDRLGARLRVVADQLDDGRRAAARLTAVLDATWRDSPPSAGVADGALLRYRGPGLAAAADSAAALSADVRAARQGYESAELGVQQVLRRTGVMGGQVIGEGGPVVWAGAAALALAGTVAGLQGLVLARAVRSSPTPLGLAARSLARPRGRPGWLGGLGAAMSGPGPLPAWHPHAHALEAALPGVAAFARGALPGRALPLPDPVPAAASTFAQVDEGISLLLRTPSALVVSRVPGTVVGPPPRTVAEVLEVVDEQYPAAGGAPGSVAVQELVHADGSRSWVVAVPGTQEVVPGGSNPTDMRTNFRLVADQPDEMSRVVVQAMRAAGIRPDEPVLLAGHSQGGIVAARVAADPFVQGSYDVRAVVTAGSPIGGIDLPTGVQVLSLEHSQDAVPALDGRPNPDTPDRTTVERDLSVSADRRDRAAATGFGAHPLDVYERTARAIEGSDDPSIHGFDVTVAGVLGGAVSARTTIVQGVRVQR